MKKKNPHASAMGKTRWKKVSKKERTAYSLMMHEKKRAKKEALKTGDN